MQINIWQILFQAFNFGVILFVLNKFMYKPIMDVLENRAKKINDGLAAADQNIKAQSESEKSQKEMLAKARKDGNAIIKSAEDEGKLKAGEIITLARASAKAEATRILASAESEKQAALKAVEKTASKLAIVMAKKALSDTLTAKEVEAITAKLASKLG